MFIRFNEYSVAGIQALLKEAAPSGCTLPKVFDITHIETVRRYHRSLPNYRATPLLSLPHLANTLGLSAVYTKDESHRFGLNAFKALGASYAMARLVADELGIAADRLVFDNLQKPGFREKLKEMTFVTATDGNHGRGVAWAAAQLGAKAVVYMPKGAALSQVRKIESEGAIVLVTEANYDETVQLAQHIGKERGWYVLQDTAWEGYHRLPGWIAEGYLTLAEEIAEQMATEQAVPSHLFLQAGVGTMAGALTAYFTAHTGVNPLHIGLLEPSNAACYYYSQKQNDGKPHQVDGDLQTIMAGLSCGVPNPDMWPTLRDNCSSYFSCPDFVAARGMRLAASPLGDDPRFIAGESAAVGLGLISLLCEFPQFAKLRGALGLESEAVVILVSTEGATDPDQYRRILHDGAYATPELLSN